MIKAYSEKLKDPRWQKKRLEILNRDKWTCRLCGDTTSTLHVHHKRYAGQPWEAPESDLITYCDICHFFVEKVCSGGVPLRILKGSSRSDSAIVSEFYDKDGEIGLRVYSIDIENERGILLLNMKEERLVRALNIIQSLKRPRHGQ